MELLTKNFPLAVFALWFCLGSSFTSVAQIGDGVFVEFDDKVGKVVRHRVGQRETLYGIAKKYGTSIQRLKDLNPHIRAGRVHGVVTVPIHESRMIYRLPLFRNRNDFTTVYYEVRPKDNVFRISRRYFSMPTSLLVSRNRIRDNALSRGQTLKIGWIKASEKALEIIAGRPRDHDERKQKYEDEFKTNLEGNSLKSRNEVAYWKKESGAKGYFVMHRIAKERSYIEITNPLSSAKLYAKVIGNIPDHLYPEEVDMVLSEELAQALGAKDSKFFVRTRYQD